MNKEKALQQIHASRAALMTALEGLDEEDVSSYVVEGNWSIKQLLSHIAAWDQTCVEPLRLYARGDLFCADEIEDHDQFNAAWVSSRDGKSYQEILRELHAIRSELLELAGQLAEVQWKPEHILPWGEVGTVANAISGLAWHENEHLERIVNWRATVSSPSRKSK